MWPCLVPVPGWSDCGFTLLRLLGLYCPPAPVAEVEGGDGEGGEPSGLLPRRQLPPVLLCPFGSQLLHAVQVVTTHCPYVPLTYLFGPTS
jgi:hypothetical protein